MATDEATRLHLYEQARATWGVEAADTLMHALPWDPDQTATKADVTRSAQELRSEMAELRAELRGEMAELRGEVRAMGGEIVQRLFFAMVATNATLVGLAFAAARFA